MTPATQFDARTIAVVGIDGSGKTSVVRRLRELAPVPAGQVVSLTCPAYHQTPNAPMGALSRALDGLSRTGDSLQSFELKATAMYLQMTLYGPVERCLLETHRPAFLLSEHHPIIDTLAYGAFYTQLVRKPLDRDRFEPLVRERLDPLDPGAWAAILAWNDLENQRMGEQITFWERGLSTSELVRRPRAELIPELCRRYRCRLPDVVLVLDVAPDVAMARLLARGDAQAELHEQGPFLAALRQSYHGLAEALVREHTGVETHIIDTATTGSVDETLKAVLAHSGIA